MSDTPKDRRADVRNGKPKHDTGASEIAMVALEPDAGRGDPAALMNPDLTAGTTAETSEVITNIGTDRSRVPILLGGAAVLVLIAFAVGLFDSGEGSEPAAPAIVEDESTTPQIQANEPAPTATRGAVIHMAGDLDQASSSELVMELVGLRFVADVTHRTPSGAMQVFQDRLANTFEGRLASVVEVDDFAHTFLVNFHDPIGDDSWVAPLREQASAVGSIDGVSSMNDLGGLAGYLPPALELRPIIVERTGGSLSVAIEGVGNVEIRKRDLVGGVRADGSPNRSTCVSTGRTADCSVTPDPSTIHALFEPEETVWLDVPSALGPTPATAVLLLEGDTLRWQRPFESTVVFPSSQQDRFMVAIDQLMSPTGVAQSAPVVADMELIAWLDPTASAAAVAVITNTLDTTQQVLDHTFVSQATNYEQLLKAFNENPELVAAVTTADRQASFRVTLRPTPDPLGVFRVVEQLESLAGIESVDTSRN